jgi:hypothetical protein
MFQRSIANLSALFLSLTTPSAVYAQAWGSIDMSLPMANTGFILNQQIVTMSAPKPSTNSTSEDVASSPTSAASALLVPRVSLAESLTPAKLAENYPPNVRSQAERVFRDLLGKHSQLVSRFGIADNDMAGAIAVFIAGSYMAYHNTDFPDANFKPLVMQMRRTLANNPDFVKASPAAKRDAFEQLAILGMMSAATQLALQQSPATPNRAKIEANMREAGRGYLAKFLQVDPSRVQITSQGLSF